MFKYTPTRTDISSAFKAKMKSYSRFYIEELAVGSTQGIDEKYLKYSSVRDCLKSLETFIDILLNQNKRPQKAFTIVMENHNKIVQKVKFNLSRI